MEINQVKDSNKQQKESFPMRAISENHAGKEKLAKGQLQ